jgi:purine-cytosine permease-like protein
MAKRIRTKEERIIQDGARVKQMHNPYALTLTFWNLAEKGCIIWIGYLLITWGLSAGQVAKVFILGGIVYSIKTIRHIAMGMVMGAMSLISANKNVGQVMSVMSKIINGGDGVGKA